LFYNAEVTGFRPDGQHRAVRLGRHPGWPGREAGRDPTGPGTRPTWQSVRRRRPTEGP
jgi:hypothetical protein